MLIFDKIKPYIDIARVDHWFKNVFVLPGMVVAFYANHSLLTAAALTNCLLSLLAMGLVASSYYVLNEVLDAATDALHPKKKFRPVPSGKVNRKIAYVEWLVLAVLAFALAASINLNVLIVVVTLMDNGMHLQHSSDKNERQTISRHIIRVGKQPSAVAGWLVCHRHAGFTTRFTGAGLLDAWRLFYGSQTLC